MILLGIFTRNEDVIDFSQVVELGVFQELQVIDDRSVFEDSFDVFHITQAEEFSEDVGLRLDGLRGG